MKLNKLQLDKMIHNTLSYDYDEDGGLHFRRFTEAQLDAYRVYGVRNEVRAKASAGVTFDFITDSEFLVLKMDLYKGSSQQWADFDLYVDGIYTKQQRFDDYTKKLLNFSLPEGEHRVTLYFPWSAETVVQEVYLSDNATVKEVSKRAKAMVVGDSITQGYISEHTSLTYANQVARDTDIELVNQGIGGFHFGVETLDEALASFKPDLFLIAYGTNDYTRYETQEEFQKNVSAYMKKLTSLFPETKMLAILPIYRNDYSTSYNVWS